MIDNLLSNQLLGERWVNLNKIDRVIQYGKILYRSGNKLFFFREKDIPKKVANRKEWERLVGVTVIIGKTGLIENVYKDQHSWRQNSKKSKWEIKNRGLNKNSERTKGYKQLQPNWVC